MPTTTAIDGLANDDIAAIRRRLEELEQRDTARAERINELERKLARGTGDVTEKARAATAQHRAPALQKPPEAPRETLTQAVERILREKPRSTLDIIEATGAAASVVTELRRQLHAARKIYNVGTDDRPQWFWRVGDDAPVAELNEAVATLLRIRPFARQELIEATGAREGRVDGAIGYWRKRMEERDHEWVVLDLTRTTGNHKSARAQWFMQPRGLRPARLQSEIEARKAKKTATR